MLAVAAAACTVKKGQAPHGARFCGCEGLSQRVRLSPILLERVGLVTTRGSVNSYMEYLYGVLSLQALQLGQALSTGLQVCWIYNTSITTLVAHQGVFSSKAAYWASITGPGTAFALLSFHLCPYLYTF